MLNNKKKYDANFTAGGLLYNEFIALEDLLISNDFENLIKIEEGQNNRIGIATNSARKRIISEINRRYKIAPAGFWNHFFNWKEYEQKLALFYLCLKTYPLVFDLHFEVAVKKYKTSGSIADYDVQMRLDEIASNNENVANWSDKTFKKLNSQYRTVLKDVELLIDNRLTKSTIQSSSFWSYFKENGEQWFLKACFIEN